MRVRMAVSCALLALLACTPATDAAVVHEVEPGETLWSVAAANGLEPETLAAFNAISSDTQLVAGSVLQIPEPGEAGNVAPTATGTCTWRCASTVHPHPTAERVDADLVADVAADYGMSPSLVQAIAWQESGFNNALVSPAGARGVMQIIPSTWNFINESLWGERLPSSSAQANVEAGVRYLHYLYHLTGGSRDATIAAYFQGPNSSTLLPETSEYLDSVLAHKAAFEAGGG